MRRTPIFWGAYCCFLLFGALVFRELKSSVVTRYKLRDEWTKFKEFGLDVNNLSNTEKNSTFFYWLGEVCPQFSNTSFIEINEVVGEDWSSIVYRVEQECHEEIRVTQEEVVYELSFIDALYFCVIITTTIGYGDITPTGSGQIIFCISYACVGIPLTGLLLAGTSTFFGGRLFRLFKSKLSLENQRTKRFIFLWTLLYIFAGFVVFIFLPAILFCFLEDWSYISSVYYAFITLTTIGFGDYIAATSMSGVGKEVYRLSLVVWVLIGLGYWIMVANFITRAMRSKRLHNSLLKRAELIKRYVGMHNDPQFLTQRSKATVNFMLQFSSLLISLDEEELTEVTNDYLHTGVPGIVSLFCGQGRPLSPTFNLFSPHFLKSITGLDTKETSKSSEMLADVDSDYSSGSVPDSPEVFDDQLMMMPEPFNDIELKNISSTVPRSSGMC